MKFKDLDRFKPTPVRDKLPEVRKVDLSTECLEYYDGPLCGFTHVDSKLHWYFYVDNDENDYRIYALVGITEADRMAIEKFPSRWEYEDLVAVIGNRGITAWCRW